MAYTIEDPKLRVVRQLCKTEKHSSLLQRLRLIILEHLLPTTEEFILRLKETGVEITALLAKPYSIDSAVEQRLTKEVRILKHSYNELETTDILDKLLHEAIDASSKDGKAIVIVDVGGYFAQPLVRLGPAEARGHLLGVVEDTTFGHNRYLKNCKNIKYPVVSVARSALKEVEARFVGRDAVAALDAILRKEGVSISGRSALVIGYGMIGKNVARSLRANDLPLSVYDKADIKNLTAYIDGYHVNTKRELLGKADVIFCATGDPDGALSFADIEDSKDNVILVSVGSKDTEFDLRSLRAQAVSEHVVSPLLAKYKLHNQKAVFVVNNGTAVNFTLPSIPVEVLDLVFSEILLWILALIENPQGFALQEVHDTNIDELSAISKAWLRFVNR